MYLRRPLQAKRPGNRLIYSVYSVLMRTSSAEIYNYELSTVRLFFNGALCGDEARPLIMYYPQMERQMQY